jgi:hypothetical protein
MVTMNISCPFPHTAAINESSSQVFSLPLQKENATSLAWKMRLLLILKKLERWLRESCCATEKRGKLLWVEQGTDRAQKGVFHPTGALPTPG